MTYSDIKTNTIQEYVEQLAALHTWVQSAPGGESSSQGNNEDADAAAVHAGQEVRLPLLLRLVALLADGAAACPWLLEALAVPEVTNRLWATFDLLGASAARQGELSWYNR